MASKVHPEEETPHVMAVTSPGPELLQSLPPFVDGAHRPAQGHTLDSYEYLDNNLVTHHFVLHVVPNLDEGEDVTDTVRKKIESGWRSARRRQEYEWARAGKAPPEVEDCARRFGGDLSPLSKYMKRLLRAAQDKDRGQMVEAVYKKLKACCVVEDVRFEEQETPLTFEGLQDCYNDTAAIAIVDISGDPLLEAIGFPEDKTCIKVRFVINEKPKEDDDGGFDASSRRDVVFTRLYSYDYALVFPTLPYPNCNLSNDGLAAKMHYAFSNISGDVTEEQGVSLRALNDDVHALKALLARRFWQCFDALYSDMSTNGNGISTNGNYGTEKDDHTVQMWKVAPSLSSAKDADEAYTALWHIVRPNEFEFSFSSTVSRDELPGVSTGSSLRNEEGKVTQEGKDAIRLAVQKAICAAAGKIERSSVASAGSSLMPSAWPPRSKDDDIWPIEVDEENFAVEYLTDRKSCRSLPDDIEDGLALVTFNGILRTVTQGRKGESTEDDEREDDESKKCTIIVDVSEWDAKDEIRVLDINAMLHWDMQSMLEAIEKMEKNPNTMGSTKIKKWLGEVAFGLHALQRMSIKKQLREVGLSVMEKRREIPWQAEGSIVGNAYRCCLTTHGVDDPSSHEDNVRSEIQVLMFVTATPVVIEGRMESQKWIRQIAPNRDDGCFVGGFRPEQFTRGGPTCQYWALTKQDPYSYRHYFRAAIPGLDPVSLLSPAERKYIVRTFIMDPVSEIRLPNGMIDPSKGGADIDPRELKAEGILDAFEALPLSLDVESFINRVIQPYKSPGGYFEFSRLWQSIWNGMLFSADVETINLHYGPEIASYFEFLEFYMIQLRIPAIVGAVMHFVGTIGDTAEAHPILMHAHTIYGFFMVIWGAATCMLWRRKVAKLAYKWDNGVIEVGAELSRDVSHRDLLHVRPEFSMRVRKEMENDERVKRRMLTTIRSKLNLGNVENGSNGDGDGRFSDRMLENDLEAYNDTCVVPDGVRIWRRIQAALASAAFVALAVLITTLSLSFQQAIEQQGGENSNGILLSHVISGLSQGFAVPVLNSLHRIVALNMTERQLLRTDREFQASLFFKLFAFAFFNYFNSVAYIAFWRRDREYLRTQVFLLILFQCTYGNVKESIDPWLQRMVSRVSSSFHNLNGHGQGDETFLDVDLKRGGSAALACKATVASQSKPDDYQLLDEVMEIALQFGMLTMFATACPIGAMIVLASCVIEIKIDLHKLVKELRMPIPRMSVGLDVSFSALSFMVFIGIFTNCAIMLLTKHPVVDGRTTYTNPDIAGRTEAEVMMRKSTVAERTVYMTIFEHVLVAVVILLLSAGGLPHDVFEEQYRQRYWHNREEVEYARDEEKANGLAGRKLATASSMTPRRLDGRSIVRRTTTHKVVSSNGGD